MMGLLTLVTVAYVEVAKVETKFIVRDKRTALYFRKTGRGTTSNKSEVYRYTRTELISNPYFDKTLEVLIPVTK